MSNQNHCCECGKLISKHSKRCLACENESREEYQYKYNPAMATAGDKFFENPNNGHRAGDYWAEQEELNGF